MSFLVAVVLLGLVLGVLRATIRLNLGDAALGVFDAVMLTAFSALNFAHGQYFIGGALAAMAGFCAYAATVVREKKS